MAYIDIPNILLSHQKDSYNRVPQKMHHLKGIPTHSIDIVQCPCDWRVVVPYIKNAKGWQGLFLNA